ncbi:guanine deaminase [Aureimonas leprariae]|uniref:Guanine deaminase n=1 Tax=Plantimonas leprariae TaxID=2615207 RepID=A0A7V7TZE1_9HYPH|nr:guanine deaminase [Aureimonas leprariae]KAB0679272.1 guanine deaminase [Aureimonas leprariae]
MSASAEIRLAVRGRIVSFDGGPGDAPTVHEQGVVLVDAEGLVAAVGDAAELLPTLPPGARVCDHHRHIVMPGFVDPHLHMPQTQVVGSFGTELMEWLAKYTFPEESRYGDPDVAEAAARFLVDELLRNGTTTAAVYCTSHPVSVDAFLAECERRSLRMLAGKVMMDRNAPPRLLDTPERGYEETTALIGRWHGRGRLEIAITPRFAPTSTDAQLTATGLLAAEHPGLAIQTHLSENHQEIAFVAELFPWAADYTSVYERFGLVRPRALFGHCIHLSEREREALGRAGASAIFCPTSNLFLGSGLFDLAATRAAGIRVGLATDIGGGTSYSMLRTAAEAYKVLALNGQRLTAFEAFHLMTAGNAEAMGMEARIGLLRPGMEADLVVLDTGATPAMRRRMERVETLAEELFALMTMGDDRAVVATYALGRRVHDRQGFVEHPLPPRADAPFAPPQDGEEGVEQ